MQQFSGLAQVVAQLQGRLQVRAQGSQQAAAPPARTTQQEVAANIVQNNRDMVMHELQLKQNCPLGRASTGQPGSHQRLGATTPLPGSDQPLDERENKQRAQQLHLDQHAIFQNQGTLKALDPVAIARDNAEAVQKAMGSQYVPQPDVHRDMWADTPTGDDEDYVDAWGSGVLSGGDQAEARRQYRQQVATSTGQQTAEDVTMSVDQQPQL